MDDRPDESEETPSEGDSGSPSAKSHFLTVGIGASAGGLEALQRFFANTPPDSGMAFVIVEHLDPNHETLMPELLARCTSMPVEQIHDGTQAAPNHVYVIPPNTTLTIEIGILRLEKPRQAQGYRTPIDRFLRSLAQDQGNGAIAIILSGTGSDGSLGLVAVKENGGFTLVQEPETAKYDSMPLSAMATGHVDEVLAVEEMPPKLLEYSRYWANLGEDQGPRVIQAEATDYFAKICAVIRRRTGHDFTHYKKGTFTRRLGRRMQVLQILSVADYVERLELDPAEVDRLFKDLLIRVTQFFRDPEAFARIDKLVIPKILAGKGAADQVRIWVAGCATGEEAYSLAILLSEHLRTLQSPPQVQIFATDIDEQSLQVGRQGRYPEGIADQISRGRLDSFFQKEDGAYRVTTSLREMCIFSLQDVIKDPPFSGLDLISCRNLLIYLEPDLQKRIIQILHYALRREGFLFLGTSESISFYPELFVTVEKKCRIFQRKEALRMPTLLPFLDYSRLLPIRDGGLRAGSGQQKSGLRQPYLEEIAERLIMDDFAPAWVIVNEKNDAVFFSSRVDKYLSPALGAANLNIINMARKGLRLDLRTTIHQARRTGQPTVRRNVLVETPGGVVRVNLHVRPMAEPSDNSAFLVAVFEDLGPVKSPTPKGEARPHQDEESVIQQLEFELKSTKENLQATAEEMETSNEELKSSNEELLSLNEEMQSSNEELQTSKEELQSINEELQTVNGELRAKVDELDRTNSDLYNFFQSTQVATLFLDDHLRIMKFTPASKEVFRLIDSDAGRPITDLAPRFSSGDLVDNIRVVLRTLAIKELEILKEDGETWYAVRISPYRTLRNVIEGVVITFSDITAAKRARIMADRRATQQAGLAVLGGFALCEPDLQAVFEKATDVLCEGLDTEWAQVIELAEDGNALWIRAARGWPANTVGTTIGVGKDSQAGYALMSAGPVVVDDLGKETRFSAEALLREHGVASGVSVLIPGGDRQFGALSTHTARPRAFMPDEVNYLQTVANFVGTALQRSAHQESLASALRRAEEALLLRDEFLSIAAHELKTPLAGLRLATQVLNRSLANASSLDEARLLKTLKTIDERSAKLASMVSNLLDVARLQHGGITIDRAQTDLVHLVRDAAETVRLSQTAHHIVIDAPEQLLVLVDPLRIEQAFLNLLDNAVKYSPRGKDIHVTVASEDGGSGARVSVRDHGSGIREDLREHIFERFYRAPDKGHQSGMGLGLHISRTIVEAHGGRLRAEFPVDGGSCFIISLPSSAGVSEASDQAEGR